MNLSDLIPPECIEFNLDGKKKDDILQALVRAFLKSGLTLNANELYDSLLKREKLGSTGIGNGIAIPHAMMPGMNNTVITFGRKLDGAKFDSVDNGLVHLFFLLVGPENDPGRHLMVLSKLARYLHDPGFRQELIDAGTPDEVLEAFRRKDGL